MLLPGRKGLERGCLRSLGSRLCSRGQQWPPFQFCPVTDRKKARDANTSLLGVPGPFPKQVTGCAGSRRLVKAGSSLRASGGGRGGVSHSLTHSHQGGDAGVGRGRGLGSQPVYLGPQTGPGQSTLTWEMCGPCLAHHSGPQKGLGKPVTPLTSH